MTGACAASACAASGAPQREAMSAGGVTLENLERTRRVAPALGEAGRPRGTVRAKKHVFDDHDQKLPEGRAAELIGRGGHKPSRSMSTTDTHKGRFMLSQRGRRVHSRQPRPRTAHPRRARHAPRKRSRRSPPWARSGTCTVRTLCTPATRHPAAQASGLEGRFGGEIWRAGSGVRSGAPRGARRVKPTVDPIDPRANPTAPAHNPTALRCKLQALKDPKTRQPPWVASRGRRAPRPGSA